MFFHDLGHIIFLKKLGYKINKIEILPFGANIETNINLNSPSKDILFISIAGIFFQILLYVVFLFFLNFNLISDNFYNIFLKYNTLLIIFNFLPIYPLDGNKFLLSLLEIFYSFKFSLFISNLISIFGCIIIFYFNYYFDLNNYSIIIFLCFKVIFYIKEFNYVFNKFLLERLLNNYIYKKVKNIKSINSIYKNKVNFINGVNERKVLLNKIDNK